MKALAYVLSAAAVLIGAEVVVKSFDPTPRATASLSAQRPIALQGGSGIPTPPSEAY